MVTEKSTGDVFAMKVMRKAHILQQADVSVCLLMALHTTHLLFSLSLPLFLLPSLSSLLSLTRLPFSMRSVTSWLGPPVLGSLPFTMLSRIPPSSTWSWTFTLGVTY